MYAFGNNASNASSYNASTPNFCSNIGRGIFPLRNPGACKFFDTFLNAASNALSNDSAERVIVNFTLLVSTVSTLTDMSNNLHLLTLRLHLCNNF